MAKNKKKRKKNPITKSQRADEKRKTLKIHRKKVYDELIETQQGKRNINKILDS